jgi:hypothetical protein
MHLYHFAFRQASNSTVPVGDRRESFRLRRGIASMVAVAAIAVGLTMAVAPTVASAAPSCSRTGCNGLDPYASGCARGAYEITAAGRYLTNPYGGANGSQIHIFWSPACQTNWPVVTQPQSCQDLEGTRVDADVENLSTGQWVDYVYQAKVAPTYVWGNMVYSPGPARAYGSIDCNGAFDYAGYSGNA